MFSLGELGSNVNFCSAAAVTNMASIIANPVQASTSSPLPQAVHLATPYQTGQEYMQANQFGFRIAITCHFLMARLVHYEL